MRNSPLQAASPAAAGKIWGRAAVAALLLGVGVAVWLLGRPATHGSAPVAQADQPASGAAAAATTATRLAAAAPAPSEPVAGTPSAPVAATAASRPPQTGLPLVESPSDALRTVQLALGGGTPEEALAAGQTLQGCKHAKQIADALFQTRDQAPLAPPEIKKALDKLGGVTNAQIERAQQEQRRCQVFDAATLARAGELLRRAYDGKAPGAPAAYLSWLQGDGQAEASPALVTSLQTQVRAAIEAGDLNALIPAAYSGGYGLGATPTQAQAYREAWLRISDELTPGSGAATKTLLDSIDRLKHAAPLPEEQQRAADTLAQQIVGAWHETQHKGG